MPISHLARLERSARRAREDDPTAEDIEVLVLPGAQHSWLYEFAAYRGAIARFFAEKLGGPLDPAAAEATARATPAARLPQREHPFSAIDAEPGGMRTLVRAIRLAGGNRTELEAADAASAAAAAGTAPAAPAGPNPEPGASARREPA